MHLKISPEKCCPSCLGFNVLTKCPTSNDAANWIETNKLPTSQTRSVIICWVVVAWCVLSHDLILEPFSHCRVHMVVADGLTPSAIIVMMEASGRISVEFICNWTGNIQEDMQNCSQISCVLVTYRKIFNIRRTVVGNKIVYHSDVFGCSNYIFILDLSPGFNRLCKDNCKMRQIHLSFGNWCNLY